MNSDDSSQMMNRLNNTRRQFVAGTAGALGGLAVGVGTVSAQEDEDEQEEEEEEEETEEEEPETVENEFEDDIEILNFARTLELLEADFYRQGLENISEEEFCNCDVLVEDSALADRVYEELETIQEHEETHAEVLGETIEDLGGELDEEPEFDFGMRVEFPGPFLATAAELEDIGVSAYAGAAPFIENEDVIPSALSIHSVEARHAAFVRTLRNETAYPEAFDEARSRSEVMELAAPFIVGEEETEDEEEEEEEEEEEYEEDETEDEENGDEIGEDGDEIGEDGDEIGEDGDEIGEDGADETPGTDNGTGEDD